MPRDLTRKELEQLYLPPVGEFVEVDVPEMQFFMVDGAGSPDDEPFQAAVQWLFWSVHPIKQVARKRMGAKFVEPPLEGLWWADDMADFAALRKDRFKWRMMIPAPPWADDAMWANAVAEVAERHGEPPVTLRLDRYAEGRCLQTMHVGPWDVDGPGVAHRLHSEELPARGLEPDGWHHEIYLNDPRRTAPAKRKTVLRQPVRRRP